MAKRQKKKKRRKTYPETRESVAQQRGSEAVTEELEVAELRWAIKRLKQIPSDYRDMAVLGKDWRDFEEIMGREKKDEMRRWAKGGVLCLREINEAERRVLEGYGKVELLEVKSPANLVVTILHYGCKYGVSFIYAADWPTVAITGMNALASYYKWNYRFKGQLMSERKGVPLGVQV